MDPISVLFYAIVCGLLSLFAPNMGGRLTRVAVGVVVGIAAAATLPLVRSALGV